MGIDRCRQVGLVFTNRGRELFGDRRRHRGGRAEDERRGAVGGDVAGFVPAGRGYIQIPDWIGRQGPQEDIECRVERSWLGLAAGRDEVAICIELQHSLRVFFARQTSAKFVVDDIDDPRGIDGHRFGFGDFQGIQKHTGEGQLLDVLFSYVDDVDGIAGGVIGKGGNILARERNLGGKRPVWFEDLKPFFVTEQEAVGSVHRDMPMAELRGEFAGAGAGRAGAAFVSRRRNAKVFAGGFVDPAANRQDEFAGRRKFLYPTVAALIRIDVPR
ncbi:MAG TPA: hypothetical protein VIT89_04115 [Solirubrobacterales bacterium]